MNNKLYKLLKRYILILSILCFLLLIMFVGLYLNFIVVINNSGYMPVKTAHALIPTTLHLKIINDSSINFPALIDRIEILNSIYSIGDIIIISSLFLITICLIFLILYDIKINKLEKLNKINKYKNGKR